MCTNTDTKRRNSSGKKMERQQNSYKINLQLNEYDKKRVCVCVQVFNDETNYKRNSFSIQSMLVVVVFPDGYFMKFSSAYTKERKKNHARAHTFSVWCARCAFGKLFRIYHLHIIVTNIFANFYLIQHVPEWDSRESTDQTTSDASLWTH